MNKFLKSLLAVSISTAVASASAAVYEVIEIEDNQDTTKYTYGQKFNNLDQVGVSGTEIFDFPVQYSYLTEDDFDAIVISSYQYYNSVNGITYIDEDAEDDLRAGDPDGNSLYWVNRYLESNSASHFYQKIGQAIVMADFADGNGVQQINIFDETFRDAGNPNIVDNTDVMTKSTTEYINGITQNGWLYGNASAPFLNYYFEPTAIDEETEANDPYNYFIRDFTTRGFFSPDNGATIIEVIPPTEQTDNSERHYGGESAVLGMSNDNTFAVGYASTSMDEDKVAFIERSEDDPDVDGDESGCQFPETLAQAPLELCIADTVRTDFYNLNGAKWTIDAEYNITFEQLGLLVTPHEDDERVYTSVAQAINSNGIAVGYSDGWVDEAETAPAANEQRAQYAVVFRDGEVLSVTEDHGLYFNSRAYDINDNNFAVGEAYTYVNGSLRTKAYYVDVNEEVPRMVVPDAYFSGASSTARAINNNGKFVGEGEVETHNDSSSNPRRREAYVYDIFETDEDKQLQNLNDLIRTCEGGENTQQYSIVEARDINDNDVIAATALVSVDRLDEKGEPVLDENGTPEQEDVVRAVLLKPISGEVEECPDPDELVERQGASFGLFSFFALFGLALGRSWFKK
ncbi:DUF3466 family protein [Thalassotalea sp. PLHSN55]|uniref:DUF3466 family protein n=1 Tax=Thalassotalea sp. PLHSN55 TaxID=3435888 RepID=UPI003F82FB02